MWSQAKKPSHPRSSARAARRATTRGSASSPNSPISIARFTTAILTVHRELWLTVPRTDGPAPASSTVPSDLALQRIAERLYPDQAVAEYERVDTVIDEGRGSVSGPLQEEHVVFIDLGFQVPGRVWHVGEQLCEPGPDAVLAALDPGRGDKDGIVGVVSDDLIQVARAERLDVVLEDFLRRACHFISFAASTLCLP